MRYGDGSNSGRDLAGRAACFRMEAEMLKSRACASDERVIKEQYLALAERWSTLAASLDAELFAPN